VKLALIPTLLLALAASALAQAPITPTTPVKPEQEGSVPAATEPAPAPVAPATSTSRRQIETPSEATSASCQPLDLTPGALLYGPTNPDELATPIPWREFEVAGSIVERREVVHALLEPTMEQLRTSLSVATLPQLAALTARFGYQLVRHDTIDMPNGTKLVLYLAPLPLVRRVDVDIDQSIVDKLLEDDVRRRIGTRAGAYLPWEPIRRQCAMLEERRRIEEFLYEEGYFEATVKAHTAMDRSSATVYISVDLGDQYTLGEVLIACPQGYMRRKGRCVDPTTNASHRLAVSETEIKEVFEHEQCMFSLICIGKARFTREQFQKDLQTVREKFHNRGYPGVRITTSDLRQSFDRRKKEVNPRLMIDQRRRVDVTFVGHEPDTITDDQLRKQLTFFEAGSADEVETAESARAITTYLQTRGFFDAKTTWTRERIDDEPRPGTNEEGLHLDKIVFRIDMGRRRRVGSVEFVGNDKLSDARLRELVATKQGSLGGTFLGTVASATSPELIADQERLKEAYRRAGYPDARVGTSASPKREGLDNAALTAALLGLDQGGDLHVRFTIDEGPPTLLSRIVVQQGGGGQPHAALCAELLGELARELRTPEVALPTDQDRCATTITNLPFRADDVALTRDRLREHMFKKGRARARVEYTPVPIGPQRVQALFTVSNVEHLRLGKVIIRGNFRTRSGVIYKSLNFKERQLLTTDRLAEGARRLRTMGLFEAVNLDMPDLDCEEGLACNSDVINAVVRVEERYDHKAEIAVEGGYSSVNGPFGTLRPILPNMFGLGLRFEIGATYGSKLQEVDARLRFPNYLLNWLFTKHVDFSLELNGLYRVQDTERFGELRTQGLGASASRVWSWAATPTRSPKALTVGPYYEFRVRSRNVDALRPIGADMDESQVAISTRTGAAGFRVELENRFDRASGQLSPLAPNDGWHAELTGAVFSPVLGGQHTFLKVSASVSKFQPLGPHIVLRADARYDQGIPLGGAVLLPEVERFFAGGDSTVRGYADDRMETEIIQVGVPPLDNVSQIRVIPSNRNIRALGSIDAQARIWRVMAGALFVDAGLLTNQWTTVTVEDIRPSVGMGLRALTPFGIGALEYAIPLRPRLGDDANGRIHFYFAARAQF
jgi:outer membrane protein assembly factor BamA